jgi:hypothetical protein
MVRKFGPTIAAVAMLAALFPASIAAAGWLGDETANAALPAPVTAQAVNPLHRPCPAGWVWVKRKHKCEPTIVTVWICKHSNCGGGW